MALMKGNGYCYIAKKDCGCTVAVCTDRPEHAKDVAAWIRDGLAVERMTDEAFRNGPRFGCRCEAETAPPAQPQGALALEGAE